MRKEELIAKYMVPTDSSDEVPKLGRRERRQFVKCGTEIGIRAVFGATIGPDAIGQEGSGPSVARVLRAVGAEQRHLDDPNIYAGPNVVLQQRSFGRKKVQQLPGVTLYAVNNEQVG